MRKLVCLAAVAALCAVPAYAQVTLDLRVVTDGSSATTSANPGDPVNVYIEGMLSMGDNSGLALWAANIKDTSAQADLCTDLVLDSPGGDIDQFKRNLGLTNPGPGGAGDTSGYGGTCDGTGGYWQVGGAQNTINNTGPTLYPVGTVVTDIANGGAYVVLAAGTLTVPLSATNDIVLALDTPFANYIDLGETGPVYAVSAVDGANISITGALTISVGGGAVSPVFTAVDSMGVHTGAGALAKSVNFASGANHEGRVVDSGANGRLTIEVTFDKAMAAGGEALVVNPAIAGAIATADGSTTLVISYPGNAPVDETCYNFDLAGSVAVDTGVFGSTAEDTDFCLCYNLGDVDGDGTVLTSDKNKVLGAAQWAQSIAAIYNPPTVPAATDTDRDGTVLTGDKNIVLGASNWSHSPTPCP